LSIPGLCRHELLATVVPLDRPIWYETTVMNRPPDISDESWTNLRSAAGIAIPALLLA
jgi:hypothetical protein